MIQIKRYLSFLFIPLFFAQQSYAQSTPICGNLICEQGETQNSCQTDCGQNLLQNAGFEEFDATGLPTHWQTAPKGTSATVKQDTTEKHEGSASLQLTMASATSYQGAMSDYIPVDANAYYLLSAWARSNDALQRGYIGWQEFDSNKNLLTTTYFVAKNIVITQNWKLYKAIAKPQNNGTNYVRIIIYGPYKTVGSIWWDDFKMISMGDNWLPNYGCTNTENAKCLDFGAATESQSGIGYTTTGMNGPEVDGSINFRSIKPKQTITLTIPAFNVDTNGLPLSPMMLEVHYKDVIDEKLGATSIVTQHRAFINSVIGYRSTDPLSISSDKNSIRISYLGGSNSNQWVTQQYLFDKTPFQLLHAVNNIFTLTIQLPATDASDSTLQLPIDYISLNILTSAQAESYKTKMRDSYGNMKVENPPDAPNPPNVYTDSNLVTFIRDPMQPVFETTKPAANEVNNSISVTSAYDEVEPVNIGLYSQNGIDNLTFTVDDLKNNNNTISNTEITLYQVISDFRHLNAYVNNSFKNTYAFIPDRLDPLSPGLSIASGTSKNIWLHIHVPNTIPAGQYTGSLKINRNGAIIKQIPIAVTVLPITLYHSVQLNPVYHDPFVKVIASNINSVWQFYKEVGFDPFINPSSITLTKQTDGSIAYNMDTFTKQLQNMIDKGFAKKKAILELSIPRQRLYQLLYPNSDKKNIYAELSDSIFTSPFVQLLHQIDAIGKSKGVEFIYSVVDEPCSDPQLRIVSDRLYSIIKQSGYKTTVTYYSPCESPMTIDSSTYILPQNLNQTIPPLSSLIDYKVWNTGYMNEGFDKHYSNFGYYTTTFSYLRNPVYNRYAHGLLAYASDASTVSAYAVGDFVNDAFNDFDARPDYIYPFTYPDFVFGYPTWSGKFIPTVNSEGIREGIKDAKYIATLNRIISENPQLPVSIEAKSYLSSLKQKIDFHQFYIESTVKGSDYGFAGPILQMISGSSTNYGAFTTVRKTIVDYISKILEAKQNPTATVTPSCTRKKDGDASCDGKINLLDFEQWRREFLHEITTLQSDFNGDGKSDMIDFDIWRSYYFSN